jgi:hypothetical protein
MQAFVPSAFPPSRHLIPSLCPKFQDVKKWKKNEKKRENTQILMDTNLYALGAKWIPNVDKLFRK